jgi:type I restriction enzyme S subunit
MELPGTWQSVRLGDVVDIGSQQVDPASQPSQTFFYVQMEDVAPGQGRLLDIHQVLGDEIGSSKTTFNAGDVVYGRLRPYLRKVFVADRDGIAVTDLIPLRSRGGIEPGFLRDYLLSPFHSKYIGPLMAGIRMPRLRTSDLEVMPLPLPPLNEQRRIVARLEELTARTNAARAALEAIPPLLDRFRQSVLAAAFRGDLTADWRAQNPDVEPASELLKRIHAERRRRWEEAELEKMRAKGKVPGDDRWKARYVEPEGVDAEGLPELPEGWVWIRMGEAGLWRTGGTPARGVDSYFGGHIPWVKTGDLADGPVINIEETLTDEGIQNSNAEVCPPGTLLVAMYGATIGKLGMLVEPAATNQACAALLPDDSSPVRRKFLFWYIYAQRGNLRRLGQGGAQPNISQALLRDFPAPIPPVQEQLAILKILEALDASSLALEEDASRARQQLTTLHQSLLAKAFRGELVPQDPADEPASVLLERIRKEREAAGANGQSRRGRKAKQS